MASMKENLEKDKSINKPTTKWGTRNSSNDSNNNKTI
jgi:hypothetical protein